MKKIGVSNMTLEKLNISDNPSVIPEYNEELASLVYQAYQPDFNAFNYHQDSWKGLT
jgi:hypothetical protein